MNIILILLIIFVGSTLSTLAGFGLSSLTIPVLMLFFPATSVIYMIGIIHWFNSIWKYMFFRHAIHWRFTFTFGIPSVLATLIGALILFIIPTLSLHIFLSFMLLSYAGFLWRFPHIQLKKNGYTTIATGACSGFFAGIFGMGGAIKGAFLMLFGLSPEAYIASSSLIGLVTDSARLLVYYTQGTHLVPDLYYALFWGIPISFAGAYSAQRISRYVPTQYSRLIIIGLLLCIAFKLLFFSALPA